MKKSFLLLVFFIPLLVFSGCNNKQQIEKNNQEQNSTLNNQKENEQKNDTGEEHLGAGYYKKPDGVYYSEDKLKNADRETFKLLNEPIWSEYATDKNRAYGFGKELKNVDLTSFKVLSFRYAKDKNNIFCFGDKLEKANPISFENNEEWDTYAKDKSNVYYNCNIINADSQSFTVFFGGEGIAKDKNHVFCGQEQLNEADSNTYVVVPAPVVTEGKPWTSQYTKDKNHVYYRCSYIVKNADSATFEIIDFNFAKDKNYIFKDGAVLEGFDPKTFKPENVKFDNMGNVIKK